MSRAMAGILVAAASLTGCDVIGPICDDLLYPTLVVNAVDSLTSDPIADPTIRIRDGAYEYTFEPGRNWGPDVERPGTYEVRVEHPGYAPWVRSGIEVTEGRCHVNTREVLAKLQAP